MLKEKSYFCLHKISAQCRNHIIVRGSVSLSTQTKVFCYELAIAQILVCIETLKFEKNIVKISWCLEEKNNSTTNSFPTIFKTNCVNKQPFAIIINTCIKCIEIITAEKIIALEYICFSLLTFFADDYHSYFQKIILFFYLQIDFVLRSTYSQNKRTYTQHIA